MVTIRLRPAEPDRDFGQLAAFFTILEDWPSTEQGLKDFYERERGRTFQAVAVDETGDLLGFYWVERDRVVLERAFCYLFVRSELRGQGIGRKLYDAMVEDVEAAQMNRMRVSVWDNCPEGRAFADHRGFVEKRHQWRKHWNRALPLPRPSEAPEGNGLYYHRTASHKGDSQDENASFPLF